MKTIEHIDNEFIENVIHECKICFVGFASMDGTPYVLPMNFGYKNGVIYLHSGSEGKSVSILEQNPKICITFSTQHELVWQNPDIACSYSMRSKSVVCQGVVKFQEDFDKKVEALDIIMKQYSDKSFKYAIPAVNHIRIWEVSIDEVTCKEFGVSPKRVF